jgi:hypothetical protein
VKEADVRRLRAATTTVSAVALLEARGLLLPLSGSYPDRTWHLPWQIGGTSSGYNVDVGYNYRLAAAYRALPYGSPAPTVDSPAIFLNQLPPAMGEKVRRVLIEAVDAYRAGLFLATAVLIGVASEAAWGQVARVALAATNDTELRGLIENPLAGAGAVQHRTDELLRDLVRQRKLRGLELNALDALEQIYRDLRNYAAHRPDESFDEMRIDRARIGTLLDGSVDYFRRLYEIHSAL